MGPVHEKKLKSNRGKQTPYARPSASHKSEEEILVLEDLGLPETAERVIGKNVGGQKKKRRKLSHSQSSSSNGDDVEVVYESTKERGKKNDSQEKQDEKTEKNEKDNKGEKPSRVTVDEEMVDYYRILELPRTATTVEIKKSYRKLALRWHPDKNPGNVEEATKKFREISEAYEVLVDEKKRKIYDQYGIDGLTGNAGRSQPSAAPGFGFGFGFPGFEPFGFGFPGFTFRDPEDVFRDFFRGDPIADLMDDFFAGPLFPGSQGRPTNRSRPQEQSLTTNFFQPFGFGMFNNGFDNMFAHHNDMVGNNFFSSTTFGASGSGAAPAMKRTSTSTRIMNGKKIVTKKVVENGVETVTVSENGVLKSKTVNGVPQAIGF